MFGFGLLWKIGLFTAITVAYYYGFAYIGWDPAKRSGFYHDYDSTLSKIPTEYFAIFLGIYTVVSIIFVNYNATSQRRTQEGYQMFLQLLSRFIKSRSYLHNDKSFDFSDIPERFVKIVSSRTKIVNFESYFMPAPEVSDSIDNIDARVQGILRGLKAGGRINDSELKEALGDWKSIVLYMFDILSIHMAPVHVIIHRIYISYTFVTYGLIFPHFWMWFAYLLGTILIALIILLLSIFMDLTKRITSIFDPISWDYKSTQDEAREFKRNIANYFDFYMQMSTHSTYSEGEGVSIKLYPNK